MAKKQEITQADLDLLDALGVELEIKKPKKYTNEEQRIIAGFEEIQKFTETHKRLPQHGEERDIFERLYAVRLDRIRKQANCVELLSEFDTQGILSAQENEELSLSENPEDDELLKALGIDMESDSSITKLTHVKSRAEKRAAEEIANRTRCEDFEIFEPLFEELQQQLKAGLRKTVQFHKDKNFTKAQLKQTEFVIVGGQTAYIAKIGKEFVSHGGHIDARLRVIYANGTESNILLLSLIRAMYKDETSRFITEVNEQPTTGLFSDQTNADDQKSGIIYVLRSLSKDPVIENKKNVLHKIGVTGSDVKTRIANAANDPTFLLSEVEIVATYKLANINRVKLEKLIHRFFAPARLDITIPDRFGKSVKPKEWFLVPRYIIDEVVEKIKEGTIHKYFYDPTEVELKMQE